MTTKDSADSTSGERPPFPAVDALRDQVRAQFLPLVTALDLSSLMPQLSRLIPDYPAIFKDVTPALGALVGQHNAISKTMERALEPMRNAFAAMVQLVLPPNWEGVVPAEYETIKAIVLDEGIPLMWIPRPAIVKSLMGARDAATRRRALSRHWPNIVEDCLIVLSEVTYQPLSAHVRLARAAAGALEARHTEASQALSANLLDSILRLHLTREDRASLTSHRNGRTLDMDEYAFRAGMVFGPVWRGFATYWPENGDPVPFRFTRHASAHSVSRRQYSRVNAVIALMLVTSVLRLIDDSAR